jgi:hypothetical protein
VAQWRLTSLRTRRAVREVKEELDLSVSPGRLLVVDAAVQARTDGGPAYLEFEAILPPELVSDPLDVP